MDPEEFRAAGHALIDWIADHRERIPQLPVQARVAPGDVAAALPALPPEGTDGIEALIADLDRVIVPGLTQIQHPRYLGWFPANAALASVLGDLASGGLGALGISWASAPALTELEQVTLEWLRRLTGLGEGWHGAIHDTASTGCLVALLAARERAAGYPEGGLQAVERPLVVYASAQAHSSVAKAALLAGFGRANVREIATDPVSYAMLPAALEQAMAQDVAEGRRPAALVVSVGTTTTAAVDPLAELLPIAKAHGAWVHIDAAMAGSALLLPECRWLVAGLDGPDGTPTGSPATTPTSRSDSRGADSLAWNPHKWMGTILDCSVLYVRDPQALIRTMSTAPSYLRSTATEVTEFRDWGIPLGRRFRALKLWFHLRLDGVEAIQARLRRDLANARWLAEQIAAEPGWRVLAPVQLQTVCARHEPPGLVDQDGTIADGEALDRHTLAWVDRLNAGGYALLTPAILDGRWMVRFSLGAETQNQDDVAAVWAAARAAIEP